MAENKNRALAAAILPLVGGAANVTTVVHCMTRLRLGLADRSLVQDEALKAVPGVMGVVEDDTYQIVLGPGTVARVTPEFEALVEEERAASPAPAPQPVPATAGAPEPHPVTAEELAARGAEIKAERKARNATPLKLFLRRIANIFVPLIPALIGCGIIAGVNGLLTNLGWAPGVTPALGALASGFMALIAVFVGYNTAKEFGGTPILGGAVASIIVFPGIGDVEVFGSQLSPGQGGVLGALGAAVLAVYVERWCRRWVPEAVDVLVTPTVTVLVSGLVTVFGLMFVAGQIASGIGTGADWLLENTGAFAGFVLGGLFLPLVMLGLHQALIPIHTTLIESQGYTALLPILAMAELEPGRLCRRRLPAAAPQRLAAPHHPLRDARRHPRRRRTADLRGLAAAGPPLHHGLRRRRGGRCLHRRLLDARRHRRLHGDRPLRLGPLPAPRGQPEPRPAHRRLRRRPPHRLPG
ncbi:PTS transporter subunit EIIC [Actinomadura keratinilytica]